MAAWVGLNALNAIGGGSLGSGNYNSAKVDDELFEDVMDDDEDVLVYSGEDHEAVINQYGRVRTGEGEEFPISNEDYRNLTKKVTQLGAYEEIIGLETEDEGETDQHVYLGEKQNYSGNIDEHVNAEFDFGIIEEMLNDDQNNDQSPSLEYEAGPQSAAI